MTTKTESTKKNGHGGKRPGAGRKQGRLSIKPLQKMAVKRELDQKVMNKADQLFIAQFSKAVGSIHIFRVDEKGTGKNKKKVHTLVTDADEIKAVLDSTDGTGGSVGDDFYFVTSVLPDSRAIDSMLDRTFGKANQSLEITETKNVELDRVLVEIKNMLAAKPSIAKSKPKLTEIIDRTAENVDIPKEQVIQKLLSEIPEISDMIQ